jgi:hypothetical protein
MFNTTSQPAYLSRQKLITAFLSLVGVSLTTLVVTPVQARPIVIVNPILPTTQVIGSPIPSPVPLIPGTMIPYTPSSVNDYYRNYNSVIVPGRTIINNSLPYNNYGSYNSIIVPGRTIINNSSPYNSSLYNSYPGYNSVIVPGRIINNSTLVNPRIINPRISDSVLINPVIINSPRYPVAPVGGSRVIYTSPGIRINLGQ